LEQTGLHYEVEQTPIKLGYSYIEDYIYDFSNVIQLPIRSLTNGNIDKPLKQISSGCSTLGLSNHDVKSEKNLFISLKQMAANLRTSN
jgi:hypothetical protein